jgi:hypothetical protein
MAIWKICTFLTAHTKYEFFWRWNDFCVCVCVSSHTSIQAHISLLSHFQALGLTNQLTSAGRLLIPDFSMFITVEHGLLY